MIDLINKVKEKLHLLDILKEIDITNKYINHALQTKVKFIILFITYLKKKN